MNCHNHKLNYWNWIIPTLHVKIMQWNIFVTKQFLVWLMMKVWCTLHTLLSSVEKPSLSSIWWLVLGGEHSTIRLTIKLDAHSTCLQAIQGIWADSSAAAPIDLTRVKDRCCSILLVFAELMGFTLQIKVRSRNIFSCQC